MKKPTTSTKTPAVVSVPVPAKKAIPALPKGSVKVESPDMRPVYAQKSPTQPQEKAKKAAPPPAPLWVPKFNCGDAVIVVASARKAELDPTNGVVQLRKGRVIGINRGIKEYVVDDGRMAADEAFWLNPEERQIFPDTAEGRKEANAAMKTLGITEQAEIDEAAYRSALVLGATVAKDEAKARASFEALTTKERVAAQVLLGQQGKAELGVTTFVNLWKKGLSQTPEGKSMRLKCIEVVKGYMEKYPNGTRHLTHEEAPKKAAPEKKAPAQEAKKTVKKGAAKKAA